jgi:hypothetical protein
VGLVRWIGLGEKRFFNELEFQRDVLRLQVLYRRSGFPDVVIDTLVKRTPADVYVTFKITEGEPIVVRGIPSGSHTGRHHEHLVARYRVYTVGEPWRGRPRVIEHETRVYRPELGRFEAQGASVPGP